MEKTLPLVSKPSFNLGYICWIDIMGMRSLMMRSPTTAGIIIGRFQTRVLNGSSSFSNLEAFPVMDGAYIVCEDRDSIQTYLNELFSDVAKEFIEEKNFFNKFIIRACVSHGEINKKIEPIVEVFQNPQLSNFIIGLPVIQAHDGEKYAPPFGIFVHDSARISNNMANTPYSTQWYIWYKEQLRTKLLSALNSYFETAEKLSSALPYPEDAIFRHKKIANQYLKYWDTLNNSESSEK